MKINSYNCYNKPAGTYKCTVYIKAKSNISNYKYKSFSYTNYITVTITYRLQCKVSYLLAQLTLLTQSHRKISEIFRTSPAMHLKNLEDSCRIQLSLSHTHWR